MENYSVVRQDSELYHWGIKGMKWGVRRYQNKDGSLTKAGQRRYNKEMEALKKEKAKLREEKKVAATKAKTQAKIDKLEAEKKKIDDERKALQEGHVAKSASEIAKEQKQHEADKNQAMKTGSAADVLKYKDEMTKQEMDAAWSRITWEQNMRGAAEKEAAAAQGKSKVDAALEKIGKFTSSAETVLKAYNTVANVTNALDVGIMLPKVDTNITNGNRKELAAFKKEKQKAEEARQKREEQESQRESKQKERAEKRAQKEAEKQEKKEAKNAEKTQKEAQKQVDDYNKRWQETGKEDNGRYNKTSNNIIQDDLSDGKKYELAVASRTVSSFDSDTISMGRSAVHDSNVLDATVYYDSDGTMNIRYEYDR